MERVIFLRARAFILEIWFPKGLLSMAYHLLGPLEITRSSTCRYRFHCYNEIFN